jgi:hypothetical protein
MGVGSGKFDWCGHDLGRAEQHCTLGHQQSVYHWFYSEIGPSGKEDGCSLSSTVDWSGVWQVLLVWPWPRPSWTTLVHQPSVYRWFYSETGPSCFAFCLCTFKSCCGWDRAEQHCTPTVHSWWGSVELYCTPLYFPRWAETDSKNALSPTEMLKPKDTSTQLKQTTKQPCKQNVLVVKSSIFTLEKISLHKFGIEFNQKFNDYVSIRILVLYDVVRRRTTKFTHVSKRV